MLEVNEGTRRPRVRFFATALALQATYLNLCTYTFQATGIYILAMKQIPHKSGRIVALQASRIQCVIEIHRVSQDISLTFTLAHTSMPCPSVFSIIRT